MKYQKFQINQFEDDRGQLYSFFREDDYPNLKFVEDRVSISKRNTLRGLHGDTTTYKLITCLHGTFQLAVVCADKDSEDYGQMISFLMSSKSPMGVLIPPNYLNGHLCLSEECSLLYKWTEYYSGPENQISVWPFDKTLDIPWELRYKTNAIMSERDTRAPGFKRAMKDH